MHLIVVGVSPLDGVTTIIEEWTFSDNPPVLTELTLANQEVKEVWELPKQISVKLRTYKDFGIGKPVCFIDQNKALLGTHFLVGFRNHGTVYSLDLRVGNLLPVASSSPGQGLHIPELEVLTSKDLCLSYDHQTVGHVYQIRGTSLRWSIFLIDADRDGTLDSFDHPYRVPRGMHRFKFPSPQMTRL